MNKIDLELFLQLNDLNDFQTRVIKLFLADQADRPLELYNGTAYTRPMPENAEAARGLILQTAAALDVEGWKPDNTTKDPVSRPAHYARFPVEPTLFIMTNKIDWCRGNALKYICRYPFKNGTEDLRKAARFLEMFAKFRKGDVKWSK